MLQKKQSQSGAAAQKTSNKQPLREIGDLAVWSLSSAKPGFGVHQARRKLFAFVFGTIWLFL
jgi:hypothetical protein